MLGRPVTVQVVGDWVQYVTGALNKAIFVQQHWSGHGNFGVFKKAHQRFNGVGRNEFGVVIQEQQIVAVGIHYAQVHLFGKVELLVVFHHFDRVSAGINNFSARFLCGFFVEYGNNF